MDNIEFLKKLQEEVSGIIIVTGTDNLGIKLSQDYSMENVLLPQNIDELVATVKLANKYSVPIYPIGSGSRFAQGVAPFKQGIFVSLQKMAKTVEYRPNNMSIEVEAGMTISEIQNILSKNNIFLPIDIKESSSTIGGLIATNAYGRKKYIYKTARFYVMGMEFVSPQGEVINVGGRTIKNVSSYDLHQLLSGSWGTFGIITKVTLRVKPIPEKNTLLEYLAKDVNDLLKVMEKILFEEKINLASLTFEKSQLGFLLQVDLEGFSETLKLQQEILQNKYGFKESRKLITEDSDQNAIVAMSLKSYLKGLDQLLEICKKYPDIKIKGNATSGLIYMKLKADKELLQSITDILNTLEGNFVFENKELVKKDRGAGYKALLRNIKNKLDPNNILVPSSRVIKE